MIKIILYKLPAWTLTIVVSLAILYFTLMPQPLPDDMPGLFQGADKVVHGIMFGALAGAIILDGARKGGTFICSRRLCVVAVVATTLSGAAIELAQKWMAIGRGAEVWDLVADFVGALLGVWVASRLVKALERKNKDYKDSKE